MVVKRRRRCTGPETISLGLLLLIVLFCPFYSVIKSEQSQMMAPARSLMDLSSFMTTPPLLEGGDYRPTAPIPVVVISALRPKYLKDVLDALANQHPNTPSWLLKSKRYLLVHRHEKNDLSDAHAATLDLAKEYGYEVFYTHEGLFHLKTSMALNAKYAWYAMMRELFTTNSTTANDAPRIMEALIIEDDAVLAPDALMTASALFREKSKRSDIHGITLGGWSGQNKIQASPDTYVAARNVYFQAMAYSMDSTLFQQLDKEFLACRRPMSHDWTEQITVNDFVANLTQLSPTVGRMRHIGKVGLGVNGAGQSLRKLVKKSPWAAWYSQVSSHNTSRTIDSFHLAVEEVTDVFGFVCEPPRPNCGLADELYPHEKRFGVENHDIPRSAAISASSS